MNYEEEFRNIYWTLRKKCIIYAKKRGLNEEIAEDALHEALYRLFRKITKEAYQIEKSMEAAGFQFFKYCLLELSRERKLTEVPETLEDETIENTIYLALVEDQLMDKLMDVLDSKSSICKKVLLDYYAKDKSIQEIEVEHGLSKGSGKVKKSRCLRKLKERLLLNYQSQLGVDCYQFLLNLLLKGQSLLDIGNTLNIDRLEAEKRKQYCLRKITRLLKE